MASLLALTILLVSVLASGQTRPRDSPEVQTIKAIIADANNALAQTHLAELPLPNIGGYLPTDVLQLTDGKLGKLNSMEFVEVVGRPTVTESQTTDGSTLYDFDVSLSFRDLAWSYKYKVNIFGAWGRDGNVTLTPAVNVWRVRGLTLLKKDRTCSAKLSSIVLDSINELKLDISPDDIPELSAISQALMNFGASDLIPVSNLAFAGFVLQSHTQEIFSGFVCNRVSPPVKPN